MGQDHPPPAEPPPDPEGKGKEQGREASKSRPTSSSDPEASMPASLAHSQPRRSPAGPKRVPTRRRARGPDRAVQDLWTARLREGDAETLREVMGAYGDRITAVVAGILRDRDAVDDVVQEAFMKVFYRIQSFKGTSSLYTWIYRIAVNATKDYIKSRKRRPASSLDDLPAPLALPHQGRPMLEGIEQRELRLQVRAAIDRLPTKFRSVLALREIDGMAYHQIAEVMGLSLGTVESRLFRARKRLRSLLARDERDEKGTS